MAADMENKPTWIEHPLFKEGVAHFESEQWDDALALFTRLAAEYPGDQELKQVLADLRLKASLHARKSRPDRRGLRRLGRVALGVLGVAALIAVLAGLSYAVYARWLLPAWAVRDQVSQVHELHELARGYMTAGDYARAAELYKQILAQVPDDGTAAGGLDRSETLQQLAVSYDTALQLTQEEKWFEALWAWRVIAAVDPNFRDVRYWMAFVEQQDALYSLYQDAEALYASADWSAAVDALEQLRRRNADYRRDDVETLLVGSLVNLARQLLATASDPGEVSDRVLELLRQATNVRPQDESLRTERAAAEAYAESFARFGEHGCQSALEATEALYRQDPPYPADQVVERLYEANIVCGDECGAARDHQGALACYEAATELPLDDVSEASTKYASVVIPTPTPTRRPATPTPVRPPATPTPRPPTATPAPAYTVSEFHNWPQCAFTKVEGWVFNADGATQRSGVRVKVWWSGGEVTYVTPSEGGMGPGYYAHTISYQGPREGQWFVAVVDVNGKTLSETVPFDTNTADCRPRGVGHQWVKVNFRART
jgi:tetratricopeptide (TPR) repeat protein